jgi:hypothetical protein
MSHFYKKKPKIGEIKEKEFLFSIGDIVYDNWEHDHLLILSYVLLNKFRHYVSFDYNNQEITENTIGYIEKFYQKL